MKNSELGMNTRWKKLAIKIICLWRLSLLSTSLHVAYMEHVAVLPSLRQMRELVRLPLSRDSEFERSIKVHSPRKTTPHKWYPYKNT